MFVQHYLHRLYHAWWRSFWSLERSFLFLRVLTRVRRMARSQLIAQGHNDKRKVRFLKQGEKLLC